MDPDALKEIENFCKIAQQKNEDSAFLVFDIDDVVEKVKAWREQMPRIYPHYAVKCNSDPIMLRILAALDIGFDCSSKGEFEAIVSLGVPADRIVYANTWKEPSHLRRAAELNIKLMTFDGEEELLKIKQLYPSAELLLRLKVKALSGKIQVNDKFGCDETEIPRLLDVALQHNLCVVGVSFYVGGQIQDADDYVNAIKLSRQAFDIAEKKGIAMYILDIGGGFPGLKSSQIYSGKTKLAEIVESIKRVIDEHFPSCGPYKIIAEPGRYFPATAFTLCSRIIGKKSRFVDDEKELMYIVNEGVYGLFLHGIIHDAQPVIREMSPVSIPKRSSIWGHSCDPADVIIKKCFLSEMKVDDWIVFEDMGAYTTACCTTFQGNEKTGVKRMVSRETLAELEKSAGSQLSEILKVATHLKESARNMK